MITMLNIYIKFIYLFIISNNKIIKKNINTFNISLSKSSDSLSVFSSLAHFGLPTSCLYLLHKKSLYNFSDTSSATLRFCAFSASCMLMRNIN